MVGRADVEDVGTKARAAHSHDDSVGHTLRNEFRGQGVPRREVDPGGVAGVDPAQPALFSGVGKQGGVRVEQPAGAVEGLPAFARFEWPPWSEAGDR